MIETQMYARGGRIIAVFDYSPNKAGMIWNGYEIKKESDLRTYLEGESDDIKIVIASQYLNSICERLQKIGIKLSKCYATNEYNSFLYHNESTDIIPFSDTRYEELEGMLKDNASKRILHNIKQYRNEGQMLIPVEKLLGHSNGEDYWGSVKTVRRFDKAVILDGGAYIGDSIEPLCSAVGSGIIHYYAFEPMEDSAAQLKKYPEFNEQYGQLSVIQKGLWSAEMELSFSENENQNAASSISSQGTTKIATQVIDHMAIETDADIFIKMDIEGSEMEALKGAEKLIQERKPSLAICVYHKENDVIEIPLYLKSLVPEFRFYLCGGPHTICIAQLEK